MTDHIPPVPPEVDLRDFREMPLEFERLFASDTWVLGTPEEKIASFHLWCKSWHQVPAGSLPDDDRILAHLSAAGPRWKRLRAHALRGWLKCSDGRFYHPVVAEKVQKAWSAKLERRTRTHNARVAAMKKKVDSATGASRELLQAQLDALLQEKTNFVTESKGREEKGREGKEKNPQEESFSAAARRAESEERAARTRPARLSYADAYIKRWGVPPTWDKQANSMMLQFVDKVGAEDAPAIAEFYVGHQRQDYVRSKHDVSLLSRDARGLRTEWLAGRRVTDTEARQADQTAARGAGVQQLLDEKQRKAATG